MSCLRIIRIDLLFVIYRKQGRNISNRNRLRNVKVIISKRLKNLNKKK